MSEEVSPLSYGCVLRAWGAHGAELKGFLTRQLGKVDAADDLLQEVFLKAMRQGRDFCELDNPRAWLFQVARNALIDAARKRRPTEYLDQDMPALDNAPRDAVDELDVCIARNLQDLGEEDRHILQVCDLDSETMRAFAEAQRLSLSAAKARLRCARERLRSAMLDHCSVRFDEAGRVCCHVPPKCD
ncbi:MAG: sigma-70 family RNA polymerase sigma factor [Hyphomicrobiales bacterium]|nr:sigma-70 family RNA polymerase sigma factor [Hyphomicrobiales bacterium]MDE2114458.1 sigma-70 family RNA polymerase sigma factor [Hyphomicrobiales bacterium]